MMIPKYRAWLKEHKVMCDVYAIYFHTKELEVLFSPGWIRAFSFDEVILMQSTGLTDANGVEIFEGDILADVEDLYTRETPPRKIFGAVFYKPSVAGFVCPNIDSADFQFTEEIGNIYQNPELLEA